jgi:hypothetical protein
VSPPAQAAYIVTLEEVGTNVVATGSGTLDLTDLSFLSGGSLASAAIAPVVGVIITGPAGVTIEDYTGFSGPMSFGSGGGKNADSGSGDLVGIFAPQTDELVLPDGYVSGSALSDNAAYDSQTFNSLGVTPGTYEWTWGSGGACGQLHAAKSERSLRR